MVDLFEEVTDPVNTGREGLHCKELFGNSPFCELWLVILFSFFWNLKSKNPNRFRTVWCIITIKRKISSVRIPFHCNFHKTSSDFRDETQLLQGCWVVQSQLGHKCKQCELLNQITDQPPNIDISGVPTIELRSVEILLSHIDYVRCGRESYEHIIWRYHKLQQFARAACIGSSWPLHSYVSFQTQKSTIINWLEVRRSSKQQGRHFFFVFEIGLLDQWKLFYEIGDTSKTWQWRAIDCWMWWA